MEAGCSLCGRAFGTEDVGEDELEEGEYVEGANVVEEAAWRGPCL